MCVFVCVIRAAAGAAGRAKAVAFEKMLVLCVCKAAAGT
jgi:hypothetical protein